jgi:hypothetical protein
VLLNPETQVAGTAAEPARALLEKLLLEMLEFRNTFAEMRALVTGFSIDAIIVERMVGICAMSLGCVMSGMGDLRTFKLLRCAPSPDLRNSAICGYLTMPIHL